MKNRFKWLLVFIMYLIAGVVSFISIDPYDHVKFLLLLGVVLFAFGLLASVLLIPFMNIVGFKNKFFATLTWGMCLPCFFYIIGYLFVIIKSSLL